jgi:CcmD family protein
MGDNLGYLFAALAVTWIGLGAYLFYISVQVRTLRDELEAGDGIDGDGGR